MSWFVTTLKSSIFRKFLMALTGLFLVLFLVVHLAGNLQLLANDGGASFNAYSEFMGHNKLIQIISKVNFALILVHIIYAIVLTRANKGARKVGYAKSGVGKNSSWVSRNMGLLGAILFVFLVVHLKTFWYKFKYGGEEGLTFVSGSDKLDYFNMVATAYEDPLYVAFYVVAMLFLAFHLFHGFSSAFQTAGVNHPKYTPFIRGLGKLFSIVVPLMFAIIPIILYLKSLS